MERKLFRGERNGAFHHVARQTKPLMAQILRAVLTQNIPQTLWNFSHPQL